MIWRRGLDDGGCEWSSSSNRFQQAYVQGFVDVSGGNVLLRAGPTNNNHLILQGGDISLNGRLFVTKDASLNGNVYVKGNVGIGTTAPAYPLDVTGITRVTYNGSTPGIIITGNGSDTIIGLHNTSTSGRNYWLGSAGTGAGAGTGNFYIYDSTAAATRMVVNSSGYVGIGTTSPLAYLDVASASGITHCIFRGNASDTTHKAMLNTVGGAATIGPSIFTNNFYFYGNNGTSVLRVMIAGSTYFTGQHGNYPIDQDLKQNLANYVGLLVSSADEGYYSTNLSTREVTTGKDAITISEALPKVILTTTDKDPAVWGVVTNVANDNINTDGTMETDDNPQFSSRLGDYTIRINGLGEGALWVTNINGDINNGDLLCSSIIPGYGRKQDDDLFHNYTAAKATMSCNFDMDNNDLYLCKEIDFNGTTYKAAFIGVSYHCS